MWGLVSDIFLMPGLSSELQEVAWLDGVTGPAVGHRFTGRNAHPAMGEWETVSTVTECNPPHRFAWAVGDPAHPSATWRFTLQARRGRHAARAVVADGAGPIRPVLRHRRMPDKEEKIVFVRLREFETGMTTTWPTIKDGPNAAR